MISQKIQEAFNKQINEEIFSSYLYLSMAAYFDSINFPGFAQWMKKQSQEETEHAMKFYHHIVERGGTVELFEIKEPKKKWESPLNIFEESLDHEKFITRCIDNLMDLAVKEKDYASINLLNWYVNEQVEEENHFTGILENLKRIGSHNHLLLMIDHELGGRK